MLSEHAICRMQQRGIKLNVVNAVIEFGEEYFCPKGILYLCSKKSIRKLLNCGVPTSQTKRYKGVYVVIQDGLVQTVGHRFKRLYRR